MKKAFRYVKRRSGAIALETAIATPIVIFALLPAIDIGMRTYAKNSLNKATKSGIEYINYGSRTEQQIFSVVRSSYGRHIPNSYMNVTAYCACIEEETASGDGDADKQIEENPYGFTYVKSKTDFEEDMCSSTCDDGSDAISLVELSTKRKIHGIFGYETIKVNMQTRVK